VVAAFENSPGRSRGGHRCGIGPGGGAGVHLGWYWAADLITEAGGRVHLAHPLGIKAFESRRVKNDLADATMLVDLLRMGGSRSHGFRLHRCGRCESWCGIALHGITYVQATEPGSPPPSPGCREQGPLDPPHPTQPIQTDTSNPSGNPRPLHRAHFHTGQEQSAQGCPSAWFGTCSFSPRFVFWASARVPAEYSMRKTWNQSWARRKSSSDGSVGTSMNRRAGPSRSWYAAATVAASSPVNESGGALVAARIDVHLRVAPHVVHPGPNPVGRDDVLVVVHDDGCDGNGSWCPAPPSEGREDHLSPDSPAGLPGGEPVDSANPLGD
jgi:hypothetical protein